MRFKTLYLTLLLCTSALSVSYVHAQAPEPVTLAYQGQVLDQGGAEVNGARAMTFRFYDAPTVGEVIWEEQWNAVSIENGHFHVNLGLNSPLPLDIDLLFLVLLYNPLLPCTNAKNRQRVNPLNTDICA